MDDFNTQASLEQAPFADDDSMSLALTEIRESIQRLRDSISASIPLTPAQTRGLIEGLPKLTEKELVRLGHEDSVCPICLNPLLAILAEEQIATAMDSPAYAIENLGVTRLSQAWQCGHIFCRRDLSKWIQEAHDSCPMCRQLLVQPSAERSHPIFFDPSFDPDITVGDLERQIRHHVDLLRVRLEDIRIPSESNQTDLLFTVDNNELDRNELSGMYS